MQLLQSVQRLAIKKVPELRPGYTVKVYQKIKEGEKERIQIYEGLIIAISSGHGADKTVTVRKVVEGIGVEKVFPIYSTNIEKIEIMKKAHVRRAKLYYMRERSGKSARLKEVHVTAEERRKSMEEDAPVAVETTEEVVETTPVETAEEVVETTPVETTEEVVETTPVETAEEVVETTPVETTEEVVETTPVETTEEVVETTPVEEAKKEESK